MAEVRKDGDDLVVVLTGAEKAESVHGDIRVPAASVSSVEVLEDSVHAVPGLKEIGSAWPGRFAIGTFRSAHGTKTFAVVHHATPRGVRICLEDAGYDDLIIGLEDPEAVASLFGGQG